MDESDDLLKRMLELIEQSRILRRRHQELMYEYEQLQQRLQELPEKNQPKP